MTDEEQENAKLIRNETAKLAATYVNGLAVAVFAVGGIGPFVSVIFSTIPGNGVVVVAGVVSFICQCVSVVLHYVARRFLRKLA